MKGKDLDGNSGMEKSLFRIIMGSWCVRGCAVRALPQRETDFQHLLGRRFRRPRPPQYHGIGCQRPMRLENRKLVTGALRSAPNQRDRSGCGPARERARAPNTFDPAALDENSSSRGWPKLLFLWEGTVTALLDVVLDEHAYLYRATHSLAPHMHSRRS